MPLAIEKSVPAWQLRNFSILFQIVRQCSNFSCSLFVLTKKVINCQQTDLNCGMALCRDGLKGEILDPNDCGLHPLIHTLLEFNLAQNIEKKKAEPRTPHFLSLNHDIVARSQEEKCRLKYVRVFYLLIARASHNSARG